MASTDNYVKAKGDAERQHTMCAKSSVKTKGDASNPRMIMNEQCANLQPMQEFHDQHNFSIVQKPQPMLPR